jgi:hypothetical protein
MPFVNLLPSRGPQVSIIWSEVLVSIQVPVLREAAAMKMVPPNYALQRTGNQPHFQFRPQRAAAERER